MVGTSFGQDTIRVGARWPRRPSPPRNSSCQRVPYKILTAAGGKTTPGVRVLEGPGVSCSRAGGTERAQGGGRAWCSGSPHRSPAAVEVRGCNARRSSGRRGQDSNSTGQFAKTNRPFSLRPLAFSSFPLGASPRGGRPAGGLRPEGPCAPQTLGGGCLQSPGPPRGPSQGAGGTTSVTRGRGPVPGGRVGQPALRPWGSRGPVRAGREPTGRASQNVLELRPGRPPWWPRPRPAAWRSSGSEQGVAQAAPAPSAGRERAHPHGKQELVSTGTRGARMCQNSWENPAGTEAQASEPLVSCACSPDRWLGLAEDARPVGRVLSTPSLPSPQGDPGAPSPPDGAAGEAASGVKWWEPARDSNSDVPPRGHTPSPLTALLKPLAPVGDRQPAALDQRQPAEGKGVSARQPSPERGLLGAVHLTATKPGSPGSRLLAGPSAPVFLWSLVAELWGGPQSPVRRHCRLAAACCSQVCSRPDLDCPRAKVLSGSK